MWITQSVTYGAFKFEHALGGPAKKQLSNTFTSQIIEMLQMRTFKKTHNNAVSPTENVAIFTG